MTAAFGILAIVCFLLVLPVASMTDHGWHKETALVLLGIVLTLFIVGVAGCMATQANND